MTRLVPIPGPGAPGERLVPASIPRGACVYILADGRFGTLHINATDDLLQALRSRRQALPDNGKPDRSRLVYVETHAQMSTAQIRRNQLRRWGPPSKFLLIKLRNPQWHDLSAGWLDER